MKVVAVFVAFVAMLSGAQAQYALSGTVYKGSTTCSSGATSYTATRSSYTSNSCIMSYVTGDFKVDCSSSFAPVVTVYPSSTSGTCSGSSIRISQYSQGQCAYTSNSLGTYSTDFSCTDNNGSPSNVVNWAGTYTVAGYCSLYSCCCPTGTYTFSQSGYTLTVSGTRNTYSSRTCVTNPPPFTVIITSLTTDTFSYTDPITYEYITVRKSGTTLYMDNGYSSSCDETYYCSTGNCLLPDVTYAYATLLWWVWLCIGIGALIFFFCVGLIIFCVVSSARRRRQQVVVATGPTTTSGVYTANSNAAYQPLRDETDVRGGNQASAQYYSSQPQYSASGSAYGAQSQQPYGAQPQGNPYGYNPYGQPQQAAPYSQPYVPPTAASSAAGNPFDSTNTGADVKV